jgi:hypothetical protein
MLKADIRPADAASLLKKSTLSFMSEFLSFKFSALCDFSHKSENLPDGEGLTSDNP